MRQCRETRQTAAWPEPAQTVAEIQAAQTEAKEAAETAIRDAAAPLTDEGGDFSVVALTTVVVFMIGGFLFLQGISGGGAVRLAGDLSPEVQECISKAATRNEASACLPPVQL